MKKRGRNEPCVCGSGKKFKKCCESKMIGKRFMATKIETPQMTSNISSFFQKKITQISEVEKIPTPPKEIKAEIKTKSKSQEEKASKQENPTQENDTSNEAMLQKS